ncbi:MAG: aldo/keto reductase [Pirellulales bacterium]|nr:aldo/keto reductase [Pirellulales bacterium]
MKTVALPSGEHVPALGLGTWRVGDRDSDRAEEIATLRLALELGASLIDTAEMYGEGRAEEVIAEAIADRRDEAFLVSKVYPHNATRQGAIAACERSLQRLRTDRLDLYLLHWRGSVPLVETLDAFTKLQQSGKIRYFGVSNFDLADMQEWWSLAGGSTVATNQVLYNLTRRGIEGDLLPWQREHSLPLMAYSPIEQGRLAKNKKLTTFANKHGLTTTQAALAWLLAHDDIMVIPKTSHPERLRENLAALELPLSPEQQAELDELFPPPTGPQPLEML